MFADLDARMPSISGVGGYRDYFVIGHFRISHICHSLNAVVGSALGFFATGDDL